MGMKKKTGIYIHIPFCRSKCIYCDFLSAPPADELQIKRYIGSLEEEIVKKTETLPEDIRTVDSVFFWGRDPHTPRSGRAYFNFEAVEKKF